MHKTGCSGDLSCTNLSHHKLESVKLIIVVIIMKKPTSATLRGGMDATDECISTRMSEHQQKLTACLSTH